MIDRPAFPARHSEFTLVLSVSVLLILQIVEEVSNNCCASASVISEIYLNIVD